MSKSKLLLTVHTQYGQWIRHVCAPYKNSKAELPILFGNPAVFEPLFSFRYRLLTTGSFSKSPTGQKPQRDSTGKIQRSVAFRPTLTDGLALSENNTLISNLENLVKKYLKIFQKIKRYEKISERQTKKSMILL